MPLLACAVTAPSPRTPKGDVVNRPPRDGYIAFFKTPDNISIELLQRGEPKPVQEPWVSMPKIGAW